MLKSSYSYSGTAKKQGAAEEIKPDTQLCCTERWKWTR